jgi:hypothetical protein
MLTATPDTHTAPSVSTPAPRRKQRPMQRRFSHTINCSITARQAAALDRICPDDGPITKSNYIRLLLHRGLAADDPAYAADVSHGAR